MSFLHTDLKKLRKIVLRAIMPIDCTYSAVSLASREVVVNTKQKSLRRPKNMEKLIIRVVSSTN